MKGDLTNRRYLWILGVAVLVILPIAVHSLEVPIAIGTLLWAAVFILLAWRLLRDRTVELTSV